MAKAPAWSETILLSEVGRAPQRRRLVAAEADRARIAADLGLDGLDSLEAMLTVTPWHDGAEVAADWSAVVRQTCGVTLEPLESALNGRFSVRVLPRGSRHAPEEAEVVAVDPEGEDPPDLLEEDRIDLAAYVTEHLSLEIDPFPRKPGVEFTPPEGGEPPSPFAVLRGLGTPSEGE